MKIHPSSNMASNCKVEHYCNLFYALGDDQVNLSEEGIESHDFDKDRDILPPPSKKIRMATTETNETHKQVMARELVINTYVHILYVFRIF